MEEIRYLLLTNLELAAEKIKSNQRNQQDIINARLEFEKIDREIRDTQVGKIQKDKIVKNKPTVKAVRIPVPFQNKIVNTATAFEVGEAPTIYADENNALSDEVDRLWKSNRIDAIIQDMVRDKKSQLQSALMFYIKNLNNNQGKEIKVKRLENKNGIMTPCFDSFGDMIYFLWEFTTTTNDGDVNNIWIYDKTKVYKWDDEYKTTEEKPHGFSKIPVVYISQENTEWFIAQSMIDRLEVSMSKLGASNDYSAYPILKLYGEVKGSPDKDEDGKALRLEQKVTNDGKVISSDAEFLTNSNASDSVKLELEKLEKYIYSLTSTPDISFDNIKGLGSVSGVAIKLMFMDAVIKAKMNEGENRTMIDRMINVFISGIVTTTRISLKTFEDKTFFNVQFNSILPDDLKETISLLSEGKKSNLISQKTGVKMLGLTDDDEQEIKDINKTIENEK